MRTEICWIALCLLRVVAASAQVPGLPQYVLISPPPGSVKLSLYLDYGGGSGANSGRHALGGQVLFDMPSRWYAAAGASALFFSDSGVSTAFGLAAVVGHEFPIEPSLRVTVVQTGFGYVAFDDSAGGRHRQVDIPIAFAVGLNAPVPMLSQGKSIMSNATAKPWIAARAQLRHVSVAASPQPVAAWRVGFGAAAGMSIVLRVGWGVRLAYDRLWIDDPSTGRTRTEGTFGVGLLRVRPLKGKRR